MSARSFAGGIHPPENKERTRGRPIRVAAEPDRVIVPLHQHSGAPCDPLVKAGDLVAAGQKIGESKSPFSAAVHATVSGRVASVEPLPHPVYPRAVLSVVIEKSADAPPAGSWTQAADWKSLTPDQIKDKIRAAGVVGMGGAAFPTHVKLSPPLDRKVEVLLLNGVECEPYLTADHRLMLEHPEEILEGMKILLKALGVERAIVCIENNKPDAIKVMRELCARDGCAEVVGLRVKYPQGAEKQLIKAVLGREVPSRGLPYDVGVLVQNVGTARAVYQAVALGKPLIERVVTVSGEGVREPQNLLVRIGTPISRVLEEAGGVALDGEVKVIMGGPMMGVSQYTLDVPVVKGTSGILVLRHDPASESGRPCVKCGNCVDACPMGLVPHKLGTLSERGALAEAESWGLFDCIECGACVYVCSSARPTVHLIRHAKWGVGQKQQRKS
jgi:Na+-translocating ferredoxin:NAD+ oxidoreductase subunit C